MAYKIIKIYPAVANNKYNNAEKMKSVFCNKKMNE